MPAKRIIAINQKGGTGKSSTVVNLAAAYGLPAESGGRGKRVLVVDTDAQQTAISWIQKRPANFHAKLAYIEKPTDLEALNQTKYSDENDYIFIDTPGTLDTKLMIQTLQLADFAILPMKVSSSDLRPLLQNVIPAVREAKIPHGVLFTQVRSQDMKLCKEYKGTLVKTGIPYFETIVANYQFYSWLEGKGHSVFTDPNYEKAKDNYLNVAQELDERMDQQWETLPTPVTVPTF